jgi:hypothetical protein
MMQARRCSAVMLVLLLAALTGARGAGAAVPVDDPLTANSEISSGWSFSLRPYFFLSGLSGSVTVDPLTFPLNSSFAKIVQRVKLGGFGVSSEFTYQMMALFRWGINDTLSIPFGYRVLGYQIRKDDIWMNTRMSGAVLGLDIRF